MDGGYWGDPYDDEGIELPEAFADPFAKPPAGSEAAPLLWPLEAAGAAGASGAAAATGADEVRPAALLPRAPRRPCGCRPPPHTCRQFDRNRGPRDRARLTRGAPAYSQGVAEGGGGVTYAKDSDAAAAELVRTLPPPLTPPPCRRPPPAPDPRPLPARARSPPATVRGADGLPASRPRCWPRWRGSGSARRPC